MEGSRCWRGSCTVWEGWAVLSRVPPVLRVPRPGEGTFADIWVTLLCHPWQLCHLSPSVKLISTQTPEMETHS